MLEQHNAAGKSKVVIARDASLHGAGAQPDEQRVLHLLDKAMAAYTGRDRIRWKRGRASFLPIFLPAKPSD